MISQYLNYAWQWLFYWDPAIPGYVDIGYYPASLFGTGQLSQNATFIEFGGEVAISGGTPHSITDMGSGQFSTDGYLYAAYQRNLEYMDLNGVIQNFSHTYEDVTNSGCYSLTEGTTPNWGSSFYFGGPGYNSASCP